MNWRPVKGALCLSSSDSWIGSSPQVTLHRIRGSCFSFSNLKPPINLTCMSMDCGKKDEHPEGTHANKENVEIPHRNRNHKLNSSPSCCETTLLSTAPLCRPAHLTFKSSANQYSTYNLHPQINCLEATGSLV